MNNNQEIEIDLLRLFRALWRKAWAIILVAVIFGSAFLVGSKLLIEPKYKAKALMYVNSSLASEGTKVSVSTSELNAAKSLVETYMVILTSRSTIETAIEQAGVPYTYEQIVGGNMISASAVNDTEVFSIEVTSTNPEEAALLANTIAEVLPTKIASVIEGSSARIVDQAAVPTAPSSPNVKKNAAIGAFLGIVLSCCVIVIVELMDDMVHDSDYLTQTYEIPVLAVIPDLLSKKHTNAYYQSAEPYAQKAR